LIEAERCGFAILVPTMIQLMLNHPQARDHDVSSLKGVLYGGSPIAERTLVEAQRQWGDVLYQLYGQSECIPATSLPPECHVVGGTAKESRRLRSAGRPVCNAFVRVVNDNDVDCLVGEVGEVLAHSPGNMAGIWRDPAATAERMLDGRWVRTRDIGYLDEDGFLYIADRKEDMIISGGFNIWPAEVENALYSHPAVLEAVVVGTPDPKWGETVRAVVTLREKATATEDELIAWCRGKVGPVKKPTSVKFSADPLPKSSTGKMLRRVVREQYWTARDCKVSGS
jgi:acyl-CoA synthetase (AMP-forming)/AMP-acid ligase II